MRMTEYRTHPNSPRTTRIDRSEVEGKDYTDVTNWSDSKRQTVRDEITRTDCEAQKAENIVYEFLNTTSHEHGIIPRDIRQEPDMDETDVLTFAITPEGLDDWMSLLTVDQTIDFIATAITEYTVFESFEVVDDEGRFVEFKARK